MFKFLNETLKYNKKEVLTNLPTSTTINKKTKNGIEN